MCHKRRGVGVLEEMVDDSFGLRRRVCRGRCLERHKVRGVAKREADTTTALRAAHVNRRPSVGVTRARSYDAKYCVSVEAAHIRAGCKSVHLNLQAARVQREGTGRVVHRAQVADLASSLHLSAAVVGGASSAAVSTTSVSHTHVSSCTAQVECVARAEAVE